MANAATKLTGQILTYERMPSSVNGNPRYRFVIDTGEGVEIYKSMSDAGFCYAVGNPGMREGSIVTYTLTRAGNIDTMTGEQGRMLTATYTGTLDNPYILARMAGITSPDNDKSPGANWLKLVALAADELRFNYDLAPESDAEDAISEVTDGLVPIYTYEKWQVFVDLAAWQEDISDWGEVGDMDQASNLALYVIAQRLVREILELQAQESDNNPGGYRD